MTREMPAVLPLLDDSMEVRRVLIPKRDVVFVRGVFEASDGVGFIFSVHGGELTIVCSPSRLQEMDELMGDLRREIGSEWLDLPADAPSDAVGESA